MKRVLMTSFEPFSVHALNSSHEAARAVLRDPPPGVELHGRLLPVAAPACVEQAWEAVALLRPDVVLALGQSATAQVHVEDRACNLDDFHEPDNAGQQPQKRPILPGGPPHLRTTARLDPVLGRLRQAGVPHAHSLSTGTFVCNHLYYQLLHRARAAGLAHQTLFVHLPLLPEQVPAGKEWPSLPLATLAAAVREVVLACGGE